jgi:dihydrofolate reductase
MTRRVRYAVGMSLDGFIADEAGGTSWLVSDPGADSQAFFATVDTVLLGRATYEVMLRHGVRSYPGLRTYVFSSTLRAADYPEVTVVDADAAGGVVAALRAEPGTRDIWLSGGGRLCRSLMELDLVDTVELGVSPLLLGRPGVPLLSLDSTEQLPGHVRLDLTRSVALPSGMLLLDYAVRPRGARPA